MLCWLILFIFVQLYREKKKEWKLAVLLTNARTVSFQPSHSVFFLYTVSREKQSAPTLRVLYFIHIVHTGVPISFIWFNRVRQRLLQFLPLYFSPVLTELVTWDSGHHPLLLAYLIWREVLRRGRKSWDAAGGSHTATQFGDCCRQGLSKQRIISAYIVQSHKIQCVNPCLKFSSCSFQMGFVWWFGCAQRKGWMKSAVIRRVLQKSSFYSLWWFDGHNTPWFTGSTHHFSSLFSSAHDSPWWLTSNYSTEK